MTHSPHGKAATHEGMFLFFKFPHKYIAFESISNK